MEGGVKVNILDQEKNMLVDIAKKVEKLQAYLGNENLSQDNKDIGYWYSYITQIKRIIGNFDNDISFISCLMAKEFLCRGHRFKTFDVSAKSQSAPGLDIDEMTSGGHRVIAEIKATIPYKETDLGAQQKSMFFKDFEKLRDNEAHYKYFFVTELKTFQIVLNRYLDKLEGVTIVLLPQALSGQGEEFIYDSHNKKIAYGKEIVNFDGEIRGESNDKGNIKLADTIRECIYNKFIRPAKELGNSEILVKSSEIHCLLKLSNRYPAVCSAMEGKKIEEEYGVKVLKTEGRYGLNFSLLYKV